MFTVRVSVERGHILLRPGGDTGAPAGDPLGLHHRRLQEYTLLIGSISRIFNPRLRGFSFAIIICTVYSVQRGGG